MRNHGFIISHNGWKLSPAYDLNPSIDKDGLALNIDMNNNALDYELARRVGKYFRLNENQMTQIMEEVLRTVSSWEVVAQQIGIPQKEIELMNKAFNV